MEDVEDLNDASGVSKHWDAGIRDGQVEGQVVCGLQCGPLSVQDKEDDTVSKPGQPTCNQDTEEEHSGTVSHQQQKKVYRVRSRAKKINF